MNQDKPSLCLHGVYSLVRVGVGLDIREPKGTMNNLIITVVSAIHIKCRLGGGGGGRGAGAGGNDPGDGREGGS